MTTAFPTNHPLCTGLTPDVEAEARKLLESAGVTELSRERAANGNWAEPTTIEDFLMYLEDEIDTQIAVARHLGDPVPDYIREWETLATKLRAMGYEAAVPPWVMPSQPNEDDGWLEAAYEERYQEPAYCDW